MTRRQKLATSSLGFIGGTVVCFWEHPEIRLALINASIPFCFASVFFCGICFCTLIDPGSMFVTALSVSAGNQGGNHGSVQHGQSRWS
jgi:hypothetical protein